MELHGVRENLRALPPCHIPDIINKVSTVHRDRTGVLFSMKSSSARPASAPLAPMLLFRPLLKLLAPGKHVTNALDPVSGPLPLELS